MTTKPKIGILGAGKFGIAFARLAIKANYPVYIAGSKEVDRIKLAIEVLVPKAIPKTKSEVIQEADIIILALPLSKVNSVPKDNLKDKIIVDAMNYWPEVDGLTKIPANPNITSSEYVASTLSNPVLIKAFNHMGYHDLEFESFSDKPKIIAYASNYETAKEVIKQLIIDVGFEPYDLQELSNGKVLEPGSLLFGANLTKEEFTKVLSSV